MTHADLLEIAHDWLRNEFRCELILIEPRAPGVPEIPDVIGWDRRGHCWAIECKTLRSDYISDQHKVTQRVGNSRFYMAPTGVVTCVDGHWGYVHIDERGVAKLVTKATPDHGHPLHEKLILIAAARKQAWENAAEVNATTGNLAAIPRNGVKAAGAIRGWWDALAAEVAEAGHCDSRYLIRVVGQGPYKSKGHAIGEIHKAAESGRLRDVLIDKSECPWVLRYVGQEVTA